MQGYDYSKLIERPKDMVRRRHNLEVVARVLTSLGLDWWLYEGALLGFYRQQDFIEYDFDVDILMDTEVLGENWQSIQRAINAEGLTARPDKRTLRGLWARTKFKIDGEYEPVSINGYKDEGDEFVREPYRFPREWFGTGTIEQWGVKYPCPTPIEDYLEAAYGCWREPVRSGNPNDYRRGRGYNCLGVEIKYKMAKERGEY